MSGGKQRCFYSLVACNHSLCLGANAKDSHTRTRNGASTSKMGLLCDIWLRSIIVTVALMVAVESRLQDFARTSLAAIISAPRESSLCTSRFHVRGMRSAIGFSAPASAPLHITHIRPSLTMKVTSSFGSFLLLASIVSCLFEHKIKPVRTWNDLENEEFKKWRRCFVHFLVNSSGDDCTVACGVLKKDPPYFNKESRSLTAALLRMKE